MCGAVDGDAGAVLEPVPHPQVPQHALLHLGEDAGRQAGRQRVAPLPLRSAGRPGQETK